MTITPQVTNFQFERGAVDKLARGTGLLIPLERAKKLVTELNLDEDDDWTYEVYTNDKMTGAKVRILDEDDEFVAFWDN